MRGTADLGRRRPTPCTAPGSSLHLAPAAAAAPASLLGKPHRVKFRVLLPPLLSSRVLGGEKQGVQWAGPRREVGPGWWRRGLGRLGVGGPEGRSHTSWEQDQGFAKTRIEKSQAPLGDRRGTDSRKGWGRRGKAEGAGRGVAGEEAGPRSDQGGVRSRNDR